MSELDNIRLNFNQDQLILLNLCLGFIMFGVALDIKLKDFMMIFKNPKIPLTGLFSQLILLPILTIGLIHILNPVSSIALGMVLVSVCPGGNVSNFLVSISHGNTALSVTLTSIVTVLASIYTPLSYVFWCQFIPINSLGDLSIQVSLVEMFKIVFTIMAIPIILGMFISYKYPQIANRLKDPIRKISFLIFLAFVVVALYTNMGQLKGIWRGIQSSLIFIFFVVMLHNFIALTSGYGLAKMMKLTERDARAISIETGIQNSGLGLIIIFNFFNGIGGMALICAWWSIWHLIAGMSLGFYWSRKKIEA